MFISRCFGLFLPFPIRSEATLGKRIVLTNVCGTEQTFVNEG